MNIVATKLAVSQVMQRFYEIDPATGNSIFQVFDVDTLVYGVCYTIGTYGISSLAG